ncbi:glycosyl transferase [Blyttiomyces helicus]|uniref:Alpha-1,3-glucosyltransferase n=1 Tax=Blyttiomyces helicus TaxID=388810 RepID=A0A4V1ISB5_9FUNG|nr:glycosyl transferase [Blyttiomyces helicus]|eukprot:RKO92977.1 glycosyl transferase [Blyttiomyces helicus]
MRSPFGLKPGLDLGLVSKSTPAANDFFSTGQALSIFSFSLIVKLLLIPSYHSTDFEVHRNWLAITHTLPISKWYYEDGSEWTLDYPPFFAWFEWTLSRAAGLFDPAMLRLDNLGYESIATIIFQRLTVMASEVVFFLSILRVLAPVRKSRDKCILLSLIFLSPGLLFVDHILSSLPYNGFLYGIQLFSVAAMAEGHDLIGGILFAIVLNFKHIYLYQAPAYFIYLLRKYCFAVGADGRKASFSINRFVAIGASTVAVFAASFGPFLPHTPQILSRLFPFKRGICHAYWAPNFWALYSFADRAVIQSAKIGGNLADVPSLTRGLVGDTTFALLPAVQPIHTVIFTVFSQIPSLLKVWVEPTPDRFMDSLIMCGFGSYLFGWHVHEKAILLVLIPLSVISVKSQRHAQAFYVLSCAGYVSLFPLLFKVTESVTKVVIVALYSILARHVLAAPTNPTLSLGFLERSYLWGLVVVELYAEVGHSLLFPNRLEFLPLMLVSVYCAIGVLWGWIRLYRITAL